MASLGALALARTGSWGIVGDSGICGLVGLEGGE